MMENLSPRDLRERQARFDENWADITQRVGDAARRSGRRPEEITLLAATKTVPPELINYAISKGLRCIGENRVQEYLSKYDRLCLEGVSRHFIGHLQTNKVKMLLDKVDMIQSVSSVKLARVISDGALAAGRVLPILLEVNVGGEESKSGFDPQMLAESFFQIAQMPGIRVEGLMAIPPICSTESQSRKYFAEMRQLFIDIRDKKYDNSNVLYLAMGMSGDFEPAIEEGANMVRIGSALFGKRNYT